MENFNISPETTWKRRTRSAFVFFCLCSLGLLMGIIIKIRYVYRDLSSPASANLKDANLTTGIVIWLVSLAAWLAFRRYYRLLKKNNRDSLF